MEFQGFQHSVPAIVSILIIVAFALISWLSYRSKTGISLPARLGLSSLRFFALTLLFLLVMNPFFYSADEVAQKPNFLFLVDNSESVSISKGEYTGSEDYATLLESLAITENESITSEIFTIGTETRQISTVDSLLLNETETNFTKAISQIQELEDDFDAAVLISDGIITYGKNPVIQASNLTIPLISVALGDTSVVKDISVRNVITNQTGYTETSHKVEVEVFHKGFDGAEIPVLLKNSTGETISRSSIEFTTDEQITKIDFEIPLEEEGLKQFSIEIPEQAGEWSLKNNTSIFSVDVSDSKVKILHLAFEIHPDVKMVRDILNTDQNIELTNRTWISNNRFIEGELTDISEFNLVILHGLPGSSFNPQSLNALSELPVIYFHLPATSFRGNPNFKEFEIIENNSPQVFRVSLNPMASSSDHPVLELPEVSFSNLAPISSSLELTSKDPTAVTLFSAAYQGIDSGNPIVSVSESGNYRTASIASWNWFKMYQSSNTTEREFVTQFISNITSWTSSNPDDERLKINPSRPVFNLSEPVNINADLINESGVPESSAIIDLTLSNPNGESRSYTLNNTGNGTYNLEIPSLSPGLYSFDATARKGDRVIDSGTGEFLIEASNSELINTIRNDDFLRTLASETDGLFFTYNNVTNFWDDIADKGLLEQQSEVIESYYFPVRSLFWFLLAIGLLGAEWLIRKYYSLP